MNNTYEPLTPEAWPPPHYLVRTTEDPVGVVCDFEYLPVADLWETVEGFALVSYYDERKPILFLDMNSALSGLVKLESPVCLSTP